MHLDSSKKSLKRASKQLLGATAISLALASVGSLPALAIDVDVNLSNQPMDSALLTLAEQASVQIMFEPALANGKMTPAISGTMSVEDALRKLLKDSDLTFKKASDTVFVIQKKSKPSDPAPQAGSKATSSQPAARTSNVGEE